MPRLKLYSVIIWWQPSPLNGFGNKDILADNLYSFWDLGIDKGIIWDYVKLNWRLMYMYLLNSHMFFWNCSIECQMLMIRKVALIKKRDFLWLCSVTGFYLPHDLHYNWKNVKRKIKGNHICTIIVIPVIMYFLRFLSHLVRMNFQKVLA